MKAAAAAAVGRNLQGRGETVIYATDFFPRRRKHAALNAHSEILISPRRT